MRSVILTIACTLAVSFPLAALAGPPLTDGDGDGVPDVSDNCSNVPNAHPANCDSDQDGYGNLCDGDYNGDAVHSGSDIAPFIALVGAGSLLADTNCDGVASGGDIGPFIGVLSGSGAPGPSGLACAGTPPCP